MHFYHLMRLFQQLLCCGVSNKREGCLLNMSTFNEFQMDSKKQLHLYLEGRVRPLDHLEHFRPYLIVYIRRNCVAGTACFFMHIREDPADIRRDAYTYFPANDMFITHTRSFRLTLIRRYLNYSSCSRYGISYATGL